MNYCNCPNCQTEECPAGLENERLRNQNAELVAALHQILDAGKGHTFIGKQAVKAALGKTTALRELLGPVLSLLIDQERLMGYEGRKLEAERIQKQLTRLRAAMGEKP